MPMRMEEIRQYPVPKGSAALWWFGQNGFIFKSSEGVLAAVDLYLTNSCDGLHPELDLNRKVPLLLNPHEVDVDLYTCTHSHQDHADPETIAGLRNKDTMIFIGPHQACNIFKEQQIETGRISVHWPKHTIEFGDLRIHGMFALPTDDTDLNHMGFVFDFSGGPTIYMTGDTDYTELLYSAATYQPQALITCINGGFNNLSHWEAAELAKNIKPKIAIPCHYDMFPDNSADPLQFRAALKLKAPEVAYQQLAYAEPLLISVND